MKFVRAYVLGVVMMASSVSAVAAQARAPAESPSQAQSQSPIIIAHRGASGERPEHTMAAYQLAVDQGADFIEPDLVLSKDGVLVVRHENEIGGTTNVASRPEFANRKTTKIIDGESYTGWFTEDFTLAELKSLRARERLPELRGTAHDSAYAIPTFEEVLIWLAKINAGRVQKIGVYPETKHPSYFTQIGLPHEAPLLKLLDQYGYQGPDALVYIQSFEVGNLQALRQKSDLPLIQLMSRNGHPADRPDVSYAQMREAEGLRDIARYANGIGAEKSLILPVDDQGRLSAPTRLVADAKAAQLDVHVWTTRRENIFLPPSLRSSENPADQGDITQEITAFIQAGVHGIFSDNVTEAVTARQAWADRQKLDD